MPLTGLVTAARKRTALIEESVSNLEPTQIKKEVKRVLDFSSELENAAIEKKLVWRECKHLKQMSGKSYCKRYMSNCAEDKCSSKNINAEDRKIDLKRILRGK